MSMSVLPGCMNILHVNGWYLWRSEEVFDPMNLECEPLPGC